MSGRRAKVVAVARTVAEPVFLVSHQDEAELDQGAPKEGEGLARPDREKTRSPAFWRSRAAPFGGELLGAIRFHANLLFYDIRERDPYGIGRVEDSPDLHFRYRFDG